MGVKYIISQAGNKIGLNPASADERSVLLRFLNEAARELYEQSDMAGSLYEQLFKVNGDQTVAFPEFVGELRACRPFDSMVPWHITQMRPRYNTVNWPDMYRNIRIKNKQTLHTSVRNQAQLVVSVHAVENPPVQVSISGPTDYSDCVVETLIMDSVSKITTNTFNDIISATKNVVNSYNVVISDIDGVELATIPNNQLEASYLLIDVSIYPYYNNQGTGSQAHYLEVLYKKKLTKLFNDADEFPAKGYDDIIVNKIMQLWAEEQNKPDLALAYDTKATRSLARKHEEENRGTEDMIALVPHGHDELLQKVRTNRPKWFPTIRAQ